jgi:hypothetical protein
MGHAGLRVKSLANDFAVLHKHTANTWVRKGLALSSPRKVQRPLHVIAIHLCDPTLIASLLQIHVWGEFRR